jgi:hypothetical protein
VSTERGGGAEGVLREVGWRGGAYKVKGSSVVMAIADCPLTSASAWLLPE